VTRLFALLSWLALATGCVIEPNPSPSPTFGAGSDTTTSAPDVRVYADSASAWDSAVSADDVAEPGEDAVAQADAAEPADSDAVDSDAVDSDVTDPGEVTDAVAAIDGGVPSD
jgi:hypothetical protein